jgi:3-oxoacyl-[acyl-carrier-protein] synthase II
MEMRRVVVTGLGIVSPLGVGHETVWSNILASKSGAQRVTDFEVGDLACQIACRIPLGDTAEGKFNPDDWMEPKEQRKVDPFIVFAMAASTQALQDAGYKAETLEQQERTGVLIGSKRARAGSVPSSFPAVSSIWPRAMFPSSTGSRAPTTRSLRPVPPGRMPSATRPGSSCSAMPTLWWRAAPNRR